MMLDQIEMQSLVDGECTPEQRAKMLSELDQVPGGWRVLALSLLEEQQWTKSMKHYVQNKKDVPVVNSPVSMAVSSMSPVADLSAHTNDIAVSKAVDSFRTTRVWLPALAASLLLAIGFYGGSWLRGVPSVDGAVEPPTFSPIAKNNPQRSPSYDNYSEHAAMKMVVTGPNSEQTEIPIYEQDELPLMMAKDQLMISRENERLRKKGFELDVRPEYYTGRLNDGRQLVVPVKHVGLKPYGL
jgi:hypothetical protein